MGAIKLSESNFNGSVLDFQKAISYAPQDDMANLGLGISFQGMGEVDEARNWMLAALNHNPVNEMAIFSLVRLSNETTNYEGCESSLKSYLSVRPDQPDMAFTLAGILYKTRKLDEAKSLCESILKAEPTHEKVRDLYDLLLTEIKSTPKNTKTA
jgi:tetratricopeptide (TPR) repeat protein